MNPITGFITRPLVTFLVIFCPYLSVIKSTMLIRPSNNDVSVVTVTFNNSIGLRRTLSSLTRIHTKPLEIIVVDGGSSDDTIEVVSYFKEILPIHFISEKDEGIYDAMNKGKRHVRGSRIHYLNAGDEVYNDPYACDEDTYLLPVKMFSPSDFLNWRERIKLIGYGYCHQGIIFPATHPDYNINFQMAADIDIIMRTFIYGLKGIFLCSKGYVVYHLDGISTHNTLKNDIDIFKIFYNNRGFPLAFIVLLILLFKRLIPRQVRRRLLTSFSISG